MKSFAVLSTHVRLAALAAAVAAATLFSSAPAAAQTQDPAAAAGRTLRVVSTTATVGTPVDISVELDSQGDEVAASFSIDYDRFIFTNPVVTMGSGLPPGTNFVINTDEASQGRIGVVLFAPSPFAASPPSRQLANIRFTVAANTQQSFAFINLATRPTLINVADGQGGLLPTAFENATITISREVLSTPITITGRVTSPSGQSLRNATISLIDSAGVRRVATTSSFGVYTFNDVPSGRPYTLSVASKRYRFAPQTVTPAANVSNLDFVGLE